MPSAIVACAGEVRVGALLGCAGGRKARACNTPFRQLSLFLLPPCRPHVQAGNIDLSGEAPPPSLPRVGAPFRFQWRAGPTDAKAPEPSLEPVAASESASGSGGSARPKEGSSVGDGLETEAVELLSSPPLQAQRVPEDLGRRPGDLESHSSPARRRLPQSFASQPSAASMLPVLEIPAA